MDVCVARILTTIHKLCDKGLYPSYGEHYNTRPFTTNICILKLFYSKLPVIYSWVRTPSGGKILSTRPEWPQGPPSLLYSGYQVSSPGVKRQGIAWTTHPLLALGSSMGRTILLPPLCPCLACNGTDLFISLYIVIKIRSGSSVIFVNFLVTTILEYYY